MTRRDALFMLAALAVLLVGKPARAEAEAEIVAELTAEGYRNISVERTLLGRLRITAEHDDHLREIVIDRGTGEVLRDLTEPRPSGGAVPGDAAGSGHA